MSDERRDEGLNGSVSTARFETGVPNLDRVLGGGFRRGSTVMVIGAPGTGKTILAQQIAFHGAARGEAALVLTAFSETHDKLLAHSQGLRFFDPELIGETIQFTSLTDVLRQGADETIEAIVATAREQRTRLVVLDGFRGMREILAQQEQIVPFLYTLGAKLALLGATTLIVVEGDPDESARYPELTVCDAIVALRRRLQGNRSRRLLEVVKIRGAAPLEGIHPYTISVDGLTVYPRFESVVTAREPAWDPGRVEFGLPDVDALLGGGLTAGTTTLAAGSPGVGKTLLGLHFVTTGARREEPALFLGFMESAVQLREKARMFGLGLDAAEEAGRVRLMILPAYDLEADRVADLLVRDIERRGVRRLVIDSAGELENSTTSDARKVPFLAALVGYLRDRSVTAYVTLDINTIVGPALELAGTPLSVLAENLLILRYAEYHGQLHRLFSVIKMRFSDYDRGLREFTMRPGHGLELLGRPPAAIGLLTGIAQPIPGPLGAHATPGSDV
ncbi:MAG TPA: ATPase domain-containing protein [Chloroflexota bacterium]|nr:ATPase domain-containing protein [Chloroflexota bacterium]